MHLKEIIFLAGSHLFTVSVIVIQMQAFFQAEHNLSEKREASRQGSPPKTCLNIYSCLDSLEMFEN